MPSTAPIGVFDSGFGGISVLRTLVRELPHENFVYYGDNANAPYGVRPREEILKLSQEVVRQLLAYDVKAIVIACNTATGVALQTLQETLTIPVVGIQPALEAAQKLRRRGKILVTATPATLKTPVYETLYAQHGKNVISLPCPGLMEFVEREELEGERLDAFLSHLFAPYQQETIDVVVLGCTHYPFLQTAIAKHFPKAKLIDASGQTTARLLRILREQDMLNPGEEQGNVTFLSSAGAAAVQQMHRFFLS